MKKNVLLIAILAIMTALCHSADVYAGNFEITPTIGYTFGGTFEDEFTGTKIEADDSASYG